MILLELAGLVVGSILTRALVEGIDRHFSRKARERAQQKR